MSKTLFNTTRPATIEEYGIGTMLYNYNITPGINDEKEGYYYNSQVFEKPLSYENIVNRITSYNVCYTKLLRRAGFG